MGLNDSAAFATKRHLRFKRVWNIGVGTHRLELLKNAVKNSVLNIPPEQSVEEYLSHQKAFMETKGGVTIEVGKRIANTVGLVDGSYIQTFTDIFEIKDKQMELERLSDAIDTMPSGVIIWDKDQKLFC